MRSFALLLSLVLVACTPYRMEIRQGNWVSPEMRAKLTVGMGTSEVRQLLGSPVAGDPFHPDRWDYIYRLDQDRKLVEEKRLTLYFEKDRLKRIEDAGMDGKGFATDQKGNE